MFVGICSIFHSLNRTQHNTRLIYLVKEVKLDINKHRVPNEMPSPAAVLLTVI